MAASDDALDHILAPVLKVRPVFVDLRLKLQAAIATNDPAAMRAAVAAILEKADQLTLGVWQGRIGQP